MSSDNLTFGFLQKERRSSQKRTKQRRKPLSDLSSPLVQYKGRPVNEENPPVLDFREIIAERVEESQKRAEKLLTPRYAKQSPLGKAIIPDPNERDRESLGEADQKILDRLEEEERLKKQRRKSLRGGSSARARPLSMRQLKALRAIEWYIEHNGIAPTFRELGMMLGGLTDQAAAHHTNALEKKGYLTREKRSARSIRILIPSSEVKNALIPQNGKDPDPP